MVFLLIGLYEIFNEKSDDGFNNSDSNVIVDTLTQEVLTFPDSLVFETAEKLVSILKLTNKRHDFHGSVLVAKSGKIIFNQEYGYANFKKKSKITSEMSFQLASVSKQLTAAAVLMLYEDSLIALDDTITKYIPELPYNKITIRQLLNHTSGLPMYFWLAEHEWNKEKAPLNYEMLNLMEEFNLPLFFYPGSMFDYSNTGYFVLASLVERVSGLSYGEYLESNIFSPLGMENSFVYRFGEDSKKENQLVGYRIHRGWRHIAIPGTVNDGVVGDKNVYSTTIDMFKWINGLNSGKILSKENVELMYTKGKTRYGRSVPYGFGFRVSNKNSEKIIYHFGKWNGFSTAIKQYPNDDDLLIIVLEHSSYNSVNSLVKRIRTIVDDNFVYQ